MCTWNIVQYRHQNIAYLVTHTDKLRQFSSVSKLAGPGKCWENCPIPAAAAVQLAEGTLGGGQGGQLLVEPQPGKLVLRAGGGQLHSGQYTHARLPHLPGKRETAR